jgi:hypothetical protein
MGCRSGQACVRDEDGRRRGSSLLDSVGDIGEDGLAEMLRACFLGVCSSNNVCAVLDRLLCVEAAPESTSQVRQH